MGDWLTESFFEWFWGPWTAWRGTVFGIMLFSVIGAASAIGEWWKRRR